MCELCFVFAAVDVEDEFFFGEEVIRVEGAADFLLFGLRSVHGGVCWLVSFISAALSIFKCSQHTLFKSITHNRDLFSECCFVLFWTW